MSSRPPHRWVPTATALAAAGLSMIALTFATVGCGGSSHTSAAVASQSATSNTSAAPEAAKSVPSASHVQAGGGGNFCKLIAAASDTASISGASSDTVKSRIDVVRSMEKQAVELAPDSLRSDIKLLFAASDRVYNALAKANYDYSKISTSELSALSEPRVTAAETRLKDYTTNVCKIS
jgi:hypothetical protein